MALVMFGDVLMQYIEREKERERERELLISSILIYIYLNFLMNF